MDLPSAAGIIIDTFAVGPLACTCTILGDPATKRGIIIDPGGDAEKILERVTELGLTITGAIHTHAHIDHINATRGVHAALHASAELHEGDLFLWEGAEEQAAMLSLWGMPMEVHAPPEPGRLLAHGDLVGQGCCEMEVLHTPGHTPGSLSFYLGKGERTLLFSGDTLFQSGVGRTDLEGGDFGALKESIATRLYALPEDTLVIPGHGPATTIGAERTQNPFVRA